MKAIKIADLGDGEGVLWTNPREIMPQVPEDMLLSSLLVQLLQFG